MKQLLLYLPVLHAGYEEFLARHADAAEVLLLGTGFRELFGVLAKDIRALPPDRAAAYLAAVPPAAAAGPPAGSPAGQPARIPAGPRSPSARPAVRVVEPADLPAALGPGPLVLPDEAVMRDLAARYQLGRDRTVMFERTFLRWDRDWSSAAAPAGFDSEITSGQVPRELLGAAGELSERSSDWWRQVGAVAARDHQVLACAWNRHHPTEYAPYFDGDPRDGFGRGVRPDLSTAIHAEAAVIAIAARAGIRLAGADLYTTTFPCPACARLIAEAGMARCFFTGAYSLLHGEQVLRAAGVTLIRVSPGPAADLPPAPSPPASQGASRATRQPAYPGLSHPAAMPSNRCRRSPDERPVTAVNG
ncbi:MAG: deoxycytidylate deaminase [Actinobacteria bacterium]|nr:deoxycytidylate deaminase [Actinomycetota bacterium]MBO0784492.1 deoxycytidylate deaminase [Actinomycetota bacterium]